MNTADMTEEQQKVAQKFADQEKRFVELEASIDTCREFVSKHKETLAPFQWQMYGYDAECVFYKYANGDDYPKTIAKAFGADGWKRKADQYTCGAISWYKTIDGVELILKEAENIKPTLREDVKIA